MINIAEQIRQLDYEDIEVITKLASEYKSWLEWNKYPDFKFTITDTKKFGTNDIIIIHNLWKENSITYSICDGEKFLEDVAYLIDEWISCRDYDKEEMGYLEKFWSKKIDNLNG